MSVVDLQIDELLKLRLTTLMEKFQNNRISETITVKKEKIKPVKKVIEEVKEEKKEESFFHRFFFSEY